MKQLWNDYMVNSERWQDNSDGWVKTMTESKENKELYQVYVAECMGKTEPLSYREWLRNRK